ncbi:hypothetical protein GQ44DRAFT_731851 [Phaeosphaeriaceae sp. PMI808]|nr:hypothetical protein GQ44DRAFT_731851 [Phaeosphaeriaceae sp. PMI808]
MPITTSCPRPDYSVGFRRQAFTPDQLRRLELFIGDLQDEYQSYFLATWYIFFPFLTCEAQPGGGAYDVADGKNAHSTALAVRAVVELFRLANREEEIDREILAFSVSYDNSSVSLYGYYLAIENKDTKYHTKSRLSNGDIVHNEHASRESFPRFWLLVEDYTRVNLVSSE